MRQPRVRLRFSAFLAITTLVAGVGCQPEEEPSGASPFFRLDADFEGEGEFFAFPFPSDHRVRVTGSPLNDSWPRPYGLKLLDDLLVTAQERKGFSRIPVAWFKFDAPLKARTEADVIPARADSPVLLVDLTEGREGTLIPTVGRLLEEDESVEANVLAVAPRPGMVLQPGTYAFAIRRDMRDADGKLIGVPASFAALRDGKVPAGEHGAALKADYNRLWSALEKLTVDKKDIAIATVFTTDDVVSELRELVDAVAAKHSTDLELEGLHVAIADDVRSDGDHDTYCELHGTIRLPQFQKGTPPFNRDGLFVMENGVPKVQRWEDVPVVVNLPKEEMPAGGFPLMLYVHGSGGVSTQVVDRGGVEVKDGPHRLGKGPAWVVAAHGIGSASSAMPVNPERLPGAGEIAYLNFANLAAFRDTFRQGVLEQRLFLDTLLSARIDPSALDGCTDGPTLPQGETAFRFRERPAAMGQSMGAMYVNLLSAVEDRIGAAVPTGAGGFWTYFILKTSLVPGADFLVGELLKVGGEASFLHPALHAVQLAWEVVDPVVYAGEVSRHSKSTPKHIYQPVGLGDSYFPTDVLDVMALAYGHQQVGEVVWETTQDALELIGRNGVIDYPVTKNLKSAGGESYTGVVVQYEGDGLYDPHAVAFQLEEVKHQYSCFLDSYFRTGVSVVPPPASLGTPCP